MTRQQDINVARAKVDIRHGRVLRAVSWDIGLQDFCAMVVARMDDGGLVVERGIRFTIPECLRPYLEGQERELDAAIAWRPPVIRDLKFRRHTVEAPRE